MELLCDHKESQVPKIPFSRIIVLSVTPGQ